MAQLVVPKPLNALNDVAKYMGIKQGVNSLKIQSQQIAQGAMNAEQQAALQSIFKDPASWDAKTGMPTPAALAKAGQIHPQTQADLMKAYQMDPNSIATRSNLEADNQRGMDMLTETQRHNRELETTRKSSDAIALRAKGLKIDAATGSVVPVSREEMGPEEIAKLDKEAAALKSAEGLDALRTSQKELADATAELRRMQADPKSQQYAQAAERLAIARQNAQTAQERLGISQGNLDIRQGEYEATGGISPDRQKMQANAQSGLRAVTKFRQEIAKPGMLTQLALPTSPGARIARAARNEMVDVLTRLRTGAALNKEEQAFYRDQAPGLIDEINDAITKGDEDAIAYKLSIFEDEFKALSGPNAVKVPTRTTPAAASGGITLDDIAKEKARRAAGKK